MNNKIFFMLSFLFLLFNKPGNAQSHTGIKEVRKEIEENNLNYFKAFSEKDSSLFNSLYTFGCWVMAPGTPIFCGPDAASEYFAYARKNTNIKNGKFITVDVYGISGDMVAEVGFYQLFNTENEQFDDGGYITLWRKIGDKWKRFRDSFNSNRK